MIIIDDLFKYTPGWSYDEVVRWWKLGSLHENSDIAESLLEVAADYLVILPISYGAWGIIMMTSAIFNALGHPLRSTILSVARMLLIYLPLAYLLTAWLNAVGVFLAATAANVIVAMVGYFWNRSTFEVKLDKEAERA